jgi:hypothetical protein
MKSLKFVLGILLLVVLGPSISFADQSLIDFGKVDLNAIESRDVKLDLNGDALQVHAGHASDAPGLSFKPASGHWNLARFHDAALDVKNIGTAHVQVSCRVENANAMGPNFGSNPGSHRDVASGCIAQSVDVGPGEQATLVVPLPRKFSRDLDAKLSCMPGKPSQRSPDSIDPANVAQFVIFVDKPKEDSAFEISNLCARGVAETTSPAEDAQFFPLIDTFGQFMHKDWPGKTKSLEDLEAAKQREAAELAAHPGPAEWDQYGGWKNGPQFTATGFFRTEKYHDKWWLVDPEGRLFWSHGMGAIGDSAHAPVAKHEDWFSDLPKFDSPFRPFYSDKRDAFDFAGANLFRKYGEGWKDTFYALTMVRLRSWGMNTVGCGSTERAMFMRKMPYTVKLVSYSRRLAASTGFWGPFPDVFATEEFLQDARSHIAAYKESAVDDPWCIGFFVENELSWGNEISLSVAALMSPADQPAKKAFLEDLHKKYETIEKLNEAWGTEHASWDALLQSTKSPDKFKALADLQAFYTRFAERYFELSGSVVKEMAPHQLNLGCRFGWGGNDRAITASAKYCDVVSFNHYKRTVANLNLPKGFDKPILISEFHFGSLDRGLFHTGLCAVNDQNERGKAYKDYVLSALQHPLVVGTHWFELRDQAINRQDENYQVGFLDVCDTPYPETIEAAREISYDLYQTRNAP